MKKFLSVMLALALVLSVMLVSCKKETAESLVNDAMAKTEAHDAAELEMKIDMVMSMMGMELEMPITMLVQTTDAKSENPTTYVDMSMSFMGEDVSTVAYTEGEWVYSLTEGVGTKMSREDAEDDASAYSDILTEFPSEVFEGVEIVKNEDGTKSVEFTLTKEQLGEFYTELVNSFTETVGVSEDTEIELSDAAIKITVKDGEIYEYVMSFDMIMTVMGLEATAECRIECDYVKFDKDVVITPPEGYLGFPEA